MRHPAVVWPRLALRESIEVAEFLAILVLVARYVDPMIEATDQILALDHGRIAELGSHIELLEQGDRYATFWQERLRAAGWRVATEHPAGSAENVAAD